METWIYVAIIGGIAAIFIGSAKFYFQYRVEKLKQHTKVQNKEETFEGKVKNLLHSLPENRQHLMGLYNEMQSKGATPDQLKPITDKINLIDKVEPYKEIVELLAPTLGGIAKRFGVKL